MMAATEPKGVLTYSTQAYPGLGFSPRKIHFDCPVCKGRVTEQIPVSSTVLKPPPREEIINVTCQPCDRTRLDRWLESIGRKAPVVGPDLKDGDGSVRPCRTS